MHIINTVADAAASFSRLYMVIYIYCVFLPVFAQQLHIRMCRILMIFLCFAFFANVFAWEMIGVQCRKVGQLGGETARH